MIWSVTLKTLKFCKENEGLGSDLDAQVLKQLSICKTNAGLGSDLGAEKLKTFKVLQGKRAWRDSENSRDVEGIPCLPLN